MNPNLQDRAKLLKGTELDTVLFIDRQAGEGVMQLDATLWFLNVNESMECEPDREVAKPALKNRLEFYSHLLNLQADQTAVQLTSTKLPATAQAGQRVKEYLRAAGATLDDMAASLK